MRRRAKVDANQAAIVSALRKIGASVEPLHFAGRGIPDLLVGFRGVTTLIEVKTEKGRLNALQTRWRDSWRGSVYVVDCATDALAAILEACAA